MEVNWWYEHWTQCTWSTYQRLTAQFNNKCSFVFINDDFTLIWIELKNTIQRCICKLYLESYFLILALFLYCRLGTTTNSRFWSAQHLYKLPWFNQRCYDLNKITDNPRVVTVIDIYACNFIVTEVTWLSFILTSSFIIAAMSYTCLTVGNCLTVENNIL